MGYRYVKDIDGNVFEVVDVLGDGNCFFHALCLSNIINILTHTDLRRHLVERVHDILLKPDGHTDVISFVEKKMHCKILPWLDRIKESNEWGDNRAAVFLRIYFR